MRSILISASTKNIWTEIVYTQKRLLANPLSQHLAPQLDPILVQCAAAEQKERQLEEAQVGASAMVDYCDVELDICHTQIVAETLIFVGHDRSSPILRNLTGNQRPSDQRKPVLGSQLEEMRVWPESLSQVESDKLKAAGVSLSALILRCDEAQEAKLLADQRMVDFSLTGEKKLLVDALNALRKAVWASLEQIRLANSWMNLPSDWSEDFFKRDARTRGHTLANVDDELAQLDKEKARLLGIREKLEEAKAAREKAKALAEAQEAQDELEELAQKKLEIEKREAELSAKLMK